MGRKKTSNINNNNDNLTEHVTIRLPLKKKDLEDLKLTKQNKKGLKIVPLIGLNSPEKKKNKSKKDESESESENESDNDSEDISDDESNSDSESESELDSESENESESESESESDSESDNESNSEGKEDNKHESNKPDVKVDHKKCRNCIKKDQEIKELNSIIKELNVLIGGDDRKERHAILSNLNFVDMKDNKKRWLRQTNIPCGWCRHEYKTVPIPIVEKINKNIFYGFGGFCSFNCSLAKITELGGPRMWNRIALLHKLYFIIYKVYVTIKKADHPDVLQKFGGYKNINVYRKDNLMIKKDSNIILPPLRSIVPIIENDTTDRDTLDIQQVGKKEKLKRSKPLSSERTKLLSKIGLSIRKNRSESGE